MPAVSQGGSGWVVWSTRASINAGTPSLTAIVETLVAVPIYWWLAIHFETYLPLLVSVCVAPLVLLRSDTSVALGVRLFKAWEKRYFRTWTDLTAREQGYLLVPATLVATVTGVLMSYLLSHIMVKTFIAGHELWSAFWHGAALGYAVGAVTIAAAGALMAMTAVVTALPVAALAAEVAAFVGTVAGTLVAAGATAGMGAALGAVVGALTLHAGTLGLIVGIFLVSVAVQIFATLCEPVAALRALPDNFRRLVFCTSPLQMPELVSGLADNELEFTLTIQLQRMREIPSKVYAYLVFLPAIALWFGTAWCYRFILKSTAWFWWPMAFLGGEARLAKTPARF